MPCKRYALKRHTVVQPLDKPYRFIPLTQGQNAIVDVEDFEWLNQWNWFASWNSCVNSFYAATNAKGKTLMHRLILNCKKNEEGDHENHNTLDNRKENLRKCTRKQNQMNRMPQSNNKSGFKGVSWSRAANRWTARIKINRNYKYLGLFDSAKEAAHIYDEAAKKYHGEFAYLNFPLH